MKQAAAKTMAILALLGIIISVIGTGFLYWYESRKAPQTMEITEEQLQDMIDANQIEANIVTPDENSDREIEATKEASETDNQESPSNSEEVFLEPKEATEQ